MHLKEIFKNATVDLENLRLLDLEGCERAIFYKEDNGIIFNYKGFEKFFDEYRIQKDLPEEVSEELISYINCL